VRFRISLEFRLCSKTLFIKLNIIVAFHLTVSHIFVKTICFLPSCSVSWTGILNANFVQLLFFEFLRDELLKEESTYTVWSVVILQDISYGRCFALHAILQIVFFRLIHSRGVARNLFRRGQNSGFRHQRGTEPRVGSGQSPQKPEKCRKFDWMSQIPCCSEKTICQSSNFGGRHVPLDPLPYAPHTFGCGGLQANSTR